MRDLLSIITTNLKVISRSKTSTFLVLLAPILIVFLIGTAFNTSSLNDINIGVYSEQYNNLSNSLINNFEDNNFNTNKVNSEQECINSVKKGLNHICVIFPPDMSVEQNSNSIKVHADNSRVNLAYNLINQINSEISEKGSELGIIMTQSILDTLKNVRDSLPNHKDNITSVSQNIEKISSKENSTSSQISNLDSAIDELKELESETNNSEVTSIKESLMKINSEISEDINNISSLNDENKLKVNQISSDLDNLINEISSVKTYDAKNVVDPIKTEIKFISKDSTNWEQLFPLLIALIILLSSMVLSSTMVLSERKTKAHFRNFLTPTTNSSFIFGIYITCLILIAVQLIILFLGALYLTGIPLYNIAGRISLIAFLSSSVFIFLGMFIGYAFKSDETTILASISAAALLIFFSNIIFPTETITGPLKYIATFNPLFVTETLLRQAVLFSTTISSMLVDFLILIGGIAVFFTLTLISRKITGRFA